MPRKKIPYSKEITAQLSRIKKMLKSMRSRGYEFNDSAFDLARRNTAEYLDYLKSLNRKAVYAQAYHIDYDTGEYFTGEEYFSEERRIAYRRGVAAKHFRERMAAEGYWRILEEHRQFLYTLPQELTVWVWAGRGSRRKEVVPYGSVLVNAFERAIAANGEKSVAMAIEANAETLQDLSTRLQQESDVSIIVSGLREIVNIYNKHFAPLSAAEMSNIETAADMLQGFSNEPSDMIPEQWR